MANKNTIPDQILEIFDSLQWKQVAAEELANFTVTGIESGCGCITICGVYPFLGTQLYVFNIYHNEESAYLQIQRAMVP